MCCFPQDGGGSLRRARRKRHCCADWCSASITFAGWRISFKHWRTKLSNGDGRWLLSETSPARNSGNATEAAHARSDLSERLHPLMEEWSGFLSGDEGKPIFGDRRQNLVTKPKPRWDVPMVQGQWWWQPVFDLRAERVLSGTLAYLPHPPNVNLP